MKLLTASFTAFLALQFHVHFIHGVFGNIAYTCNQPSSCGDIVNITYPFRLIGDPENCGESKYELSCINNQTVISLKAGNYVVKSINYNNFTIRVSDLGVRDGNCSSTPLYSISWYRSDGYNPYSLANSSNVERIAFLSCQKRVNSPFYVNTSDCIADTKIHRYVIVEELDLSKLDYSCVVDLVTTTTLLRDREKNFTYVDIHKEFVYGLELSYAEIQCKACIGRRLGQGACEFRNNTIILNCFKSSKCDRQCILDRIRSYTQSALIVLKLVAQFILAPWLLVRTLCGFPCLFMFLCYKWRKRPLSMDDSLEEFLQAQNNLLPIRYSYAQIKKITKGFQEKLGEGGFGSVFKGKLRSGSLVAVKILGKSNANGQDFINEVATIGRIHHVNIVKLVGFCSEGPKRALIYDFMPKGSLEKYTFSKDRPAPLSWTKMYEISLGVARGIEYLHCGCDMQILHFDIKPHNVLLNENFVPKISDFGLAKLYSTDDSIVSVTAARGTLGYIAPELIYKKIGGVSYKADVYSFGMLLMELTGKRKGKSVETTESSSQNYFPLWVYNEIMNERVGSDSSQRNVKNEEDDIARKMVIVALWCIQMRPNDRPSMRNVIKMLEGDVETLPVPPEPSFNMEEVPTNDVEEGTTETWSSFTSTLHSESTRLIVTGD